MKRVFIVHGWDGYPEEGWFPWLKENLLAEGFHVFVPKLPNTNNPRIYNWVPKLTEAVSIPNENTYLVGHSMGCQTIARYLEILPKNMKLGGVVFVAGFFKHLTGIGKTTEEKGTVRHWLETPVDLNKVKDHLPKSVAIFSDNDPFVPLDNQDDFKNKLGSEIVIKRKMGHFSGSDGIKELPIVLEKLLEMTS